MKRLFFIFCFLSLFIFCACDSNKQIEPVAEKQVFADDINNIICQEIQNMENSSSLDDETIKALSVIIRTNLKNQENDLILTKDTSTVNKSQNQHILNLVKETSGEVLTNEENEPLYLYIDDSNETWIREIKKSKILKFLSENNISLSSISNITIEKDEFERTQNLNLNGKIIPFKTLMNEFDIPSNNIYNIESDLTSIKIYGKGKGLYKNFDTNEAEMCAREGQKYQKILKNHYNNFQIITSG